MQVLSFKVTDEQAKAVRNLARRKNKTISEYLRASAFPAVSRPTKRINKKHPVSGLIVDVTPGPEITTEQVNAMLADCA